jgi:Tol biopolymer transport system component
MTQPQQFTFSGKRAGEGYYSADEKLMIFQSEREPNNPFYQMYLMDIASNKVTRLSPGFGKTTCGWIHPNSKSVIYSSTQGDQKSQSLQKEELDFRASGKTRRYSWDYDPEFEIYSSTINGKNYKNLTRAKGYDAEASISPDGRWIAFSSNRHAYTSSLSDADKALLEKDPSYFLDIYIMDTQGNNVKRLTSTPGYDGGPFFSPDGQRITWRRFNAEGTTAEIFTMNIDGTDEKQISRLGVMSWAPFYHPSGDYIIFSSNLYGFDNFELFIVDTQGLKNPVRVSTMDGFDGLPVFLPSGTKLSWNRKLPNGESQIFSSLWNDEKAREALNLPKKFPKPDELSPTLSIEDSKRIVQFLASEEMKGRATGSPEETIYTDKISNFFSQLGLKPAIGNSYIQNFPYAADVQVGSNNSLVEINSTQKDLLIGKDWTPLKFSKAGEVPASEVALAGYGIIAPATSNQKAYDSYSGLDVKNKWVIIFRYIPENLDSQRREHLLRYSRLEHKLAVARESGAKGIIIVSGPTSKAKNELIPFTRGASVETSLPAINVTDAIAQIWLKQAGLDLKNYQQKLDHEEEVTGIAIPGLKLAGKIDLRHTRGAGRNVIGLIKVPGAKSSIIIGAHADHLGSGKTESSLMTSSDRSEIHYGADDNASGVSAVLELAHSYQDKVKTKTIHLKQNIIFAIWSGEELGNLGSSNFISKYGNNIKNVSAYMNMDMIGRLKKDDGTGTLAVQGTGSSDDWKNIIESTPKTVPISLTEDPYLPTDAMSFYVGGVPILSFFTGVHSDYHSPRDTADRIDYDGLTQTAGFISNIVNRIAQENLNPKYKKIESPSLQNRRGFRIFLGTVPDYTQDKNAGVKLSGVISGGPAEKAGLKAGDIIVEFSDLKIENIHDYVYSIESVRPGVETKITVLRGKDRVSLNITPQAKE